MAVRLWSGETIHIGGRMPNFTLVFNTPQAFRDAMLSGSPLQLANAYFSGALDVDGDLYRALDLQRDFGQQRLRLTEKIWILAKLLSPGLPAGDGIGGAVTSAVRCAPFNGAARANSRAQNAMAIAFHYDLPSEFYHTWLDERMVYSCAYFAHPDDSLATAQANKLEHLCRKLRLKPGEKLLDVGCGWGALAIWAAKHYGVRVTGITLSRNQLEWARERVRREGLSGQVTLEYLDYRELKEEASFDKVASVGMFEHVGLKNLPVYFGAVHRVLKPGGLFLNHGITHDEEGWNKTLTTEFINRYVFPDGELDTVSNIQREMERSQFEIWDVEGLRPHYARTLRQWVARLEAAHQAALRHVDESTWRVWRLYMAGSALHFENGDIGVYQILASKRAPNTVPVPMTRKDLY
jgi:cyclopropane-fatty-acyl-phospholipid synthase